MAALPADDEFPMQINDAQDHTVTVLGITIHESLAPYLYAAIVLLVDAGGTDDPNVMAALGVLGTAVANQANVPGMQALAAEAEETVSDLSNFNENFPEPVQAVEFLETQPAPESPKDLRMIEHILREKVLGISENAEDHIIMASGPLQDAIHNSNPQANPYSVDSDDDN